MCIIAAKSKGLELPSYVRLFSMFECNSDGAGFMFNNNGKIIVKKGLMTFNDFVSTLYDYNDKYDLTNKDLIMHFRLATHGGLDKGLTHPFSISKDFNNMKKLDNVLEIGVCHNGIYDIDTDEGVSDSMVFIKENILPLYKKDKKFYNNSEVFSKLYVPFNKLAFLTKDGIKLLGKGFIRDEDDGIYYSNMSYSYYDDYFEDFDLDYSLYEDSYFGMMVEEHIEEKEIEFAEEFGDMYEI